MTKQGLAFRRLAANEFELAYAIVSEAAAWLHGRHLPAWLVPPAIYHHRHMRGENYGLLIDNEVCAVVSLTTYRPEAWRDYMPETGFVWLASLAVQRRLKGQSLGHSLLAQAEAFEQHQGIRSIYLDCYYSNGRLPDYYTRAGYRWLARRALVFEDGSIHDSVLMRKMLTQVWADKPV